MASGLCYAHLQTLSGGVERVRIIDGRIPHSLLIELLSDKGIGTMLRRDETSTLGDMLRRVEPLEYPGDE